MNAAPLESPAASADNPSENLAIRRERDAAAYRAARVSAAASARELLETLLAGDPVRDVQAQARATMSKVGLLWEAAAHLSEHE